MALPKSPNLSIEFVIVGASVAGLGAAYKLREVGHEVTLLDKEMAQRSWGDTRSAEYGTSNIYDAWRRNTSPRMRDQMLGNNIHARYCDTGEILGRMKFFDEIMDDLGAAFYMLPLIGADGHNSRLRDALVALPTPPTAHADDSDDGGYTFSLPSNVHKITGGTCIIPLEALKIDSDLVAFTDLTDFQIWTGHNLLASGHRCGTDLYILSIVRTQATPETTVDEDSDWALTDLTIDEEYRAIINAQDSITASSGSHDYLNTQPLAIAQYNISRKCSDWQILLLGSSSSAMPLMQYQYIVPIIPQYLIPVLAPHLAHPHPVLIEAYNEIRYARTVATERSEIAGVVASSLGPGPARERRNQQFRDMARADSMENADSMIAAVWEDYLKQFVYDAKEAWMSGSY
ncbi:hypothetical protein C8J57DRAFT_1680430 [Mycena rebaudengoi]|nr:hypothetical protein C8J57DRAFT_1680430 [Mycena rebaudengoi]